MQGSDTRLDHVLLTLGHLYQVYDQPHIDPTVREKVHQSLEARWKKADQDPHILSVFYNSYVRGHCFNRRVLPPIVLIDMARRAFKRFFRVDTTSDFLNGLLAYSNGVQEFAPARMLLNVFEEDARKAGKVCLSDCAFSGYFILTPQFKQRVDIKKMWEMMDVSPGTICTGREGVAQLGVHLSSVIASTGDTERTFSIMGTIHTARRSKLSPAKVHKTTAIKMHMKRAGREDGTDQPRKRRRFGTELPDRDNTPPTPSPLRTLQPSLLLSSPTILTPSPSTSQTTSTSSLPLNVPVMFQPSADPQPPASQHMFPQELIENPFDQISRQLIEEATRSWEEDESEEEYEPWDPTSFHPDALVLDESATHELLQHVATPVRPSGPRTRKTCIPLRDLFLYSRPANQPGPHIPSTARLDLFWEDGRRSLEEEMDEAQTGVPVE